MVKKIAKAVFGVIYWLLWLVSIIMGIGNMPSGFGACFWILAVLLTPRKVMDWLWESWQVRAVFLAGLLYYMGHYIPLEDVHRAAENFCGFLERIRAVFATVGL